MKKKEIINFKMQGDSGIPELYIYGSIGADWLEEGITLKYLSDELKKIKSEYLLMRINSDGGKAFEGFAMYNILKDHKSKIIAVNDGIVASAATDVALAADYFVTPITSLFMIHNPYTFAYGDSKELIKQAEILEKIENITIEIYKEKTNLDYTIIKTMMDDETWFNGVEAFKYGFSDYLNLNEIFNELQINMKNLNYYHMKNIKNEVNKMENDTQISIDEQIKNAIKKENERLQKINELCENNPYKNSSEFIEFIKKMKNDETKQASDVAYLLMTDYIKFMKKPSSNSYFDIEESGVNEIMPLEKETIIKNSNVHESENNILKYVEMKTKKILNIK